MRILRRSIGWSRETRDSVSSSRHLSLHLRACSCSSMSSLWRAILFGDGCAQNGSADARTASALFNNTSARYRVHGSCLVEGSHQQRQARETVIHLLFGWLTNDVMNKETCEFCDGVVAEAVRRVPFHYRKELIYVDNVPVRVCGRCGKLCFPATVYKKLERIAAGRKQIKAKITFPLADYGATETLERH